MRVHLVVLVAAGLIVAACGGGSPSAEPAPDPTGAPSDDATSAATPDPSPPDTATPTPTPTSASPTADPEASPPVTATPEATSSPTSSPTGSAEGSVASGDCPSGGEGWTDGPVARAELLRDGDGDSPTVHAVVYPHPSYEGNPWSQWGQGIVLDDGRHLSAIGDHLGADANSYLYSYDPESRELRTIGDVLSVVDHTPGAWGYGKIHAQMTAGPCGDVYVTTYWGTRRNLVYGDGYTGDRLLRIDPDDETISDLGVLATERGVPSMAGSADGRLLFAEAVEPESNKGIVVVYDVVAGEVVDEVRESGHTGFRSLGVEADDDVLFSVGDGRLVRYDPDTGDVSRAEDMPGGFLRAVAGPDDDSVLYGVTRKPEVFFSMSPDGDLSRLGEARGYVASMAFDPDGERILYVPHAHGGSWEEGTPLVAFDPETGDEDVLVELNDLAVDEFGLRLGGTYNLTVDPERRLVYIGMNAGDADTKDESFGEVVLVIVELP